MFRVTEAQVAHIAKTSIGPIVRGFVRTLNEKGDGYSVNTYLRVCHFIGQCAEESDHFNTTVEYGSDAYFARYNGRHDLGNTQPGDGPRYKGRGVIQITGRYNYTKAGQALGLDLVGNPELAADPEVGTLIALWYWNWANVNQFADKDDIVGETRKINGGLLNLKTREMFIARAKEELKSGPQTSDQPPPTGLPPGPPPAKPPRQPDDPGPVPADEPVDFSGFFNAIANFFRWIFRG